MFRIKCDSATKCDIVLDFQIEIDNHQRVVFIYLYINLAPDTLPYHCLCFIFPTNMYPVRWNIYLFIFSIFKFSILSCKKRTNLRQRAFCFHVKMFFFITKKKNIVRKYSRIFSHLQKKNAYLSFRDSSKIEFK